MLIPGIWEEIAFRGVILTLLMKKYSKRKSIIIDGILFGSAHLVNFFRGADLISTLVQMVFATTIGFAFAYMYIKTECLIPGIIAHYLIDAVNPLFLNYFITDMLLMLLLLILTIIFIVILAPLLAIFFVKLVMKKQEDL